MALKRLIYIPLLLLFFAASAQPPKYSDTFYDYAQPKGVAMEESVHINEQAFGQPVTYKLYKASVPSNYYLIFLHGTGEKGPLDGSLIDLVDKLGYPKYAKAGFEFPFNLVVPQSAGEHRNLMKFFPAYIKLKYNAQAIAVTGLSMGGYNTYDAKLYDNMDIICAIAPVCGAGRLTEVAKYPNINAWHFHGDKDPTVSYKTAKAFIDAFNTANDGPDIRFTLYPGVAHNAWDKAYSVTPGQDELLQWIIKQFDSTPFTGRFNVDEFKLDVLRVIEQMHQEGEL